MAGEKPPEPDTSASDDEISGGDNPKQPVIPSEILEKLPEDEQQVVLRAFQASYFEGPMPPPAILRGYEDVLAGSADRIISMAEKQQAHRMDMERAVIESDIQMERLGLVAGFVLALTVAVGSMGLIYTGNEITGLVVLIGEVVALVGAFYGVQRRRQHELAEREKRDEPTEKPS